MRKQIIAAMVGAMLTAMVFGLMAFDGKCENTDSIEYILVRTNGREISIFFADGKSETIKREGSFDYEKFNHSINQVLNRFGKEGYKINGTTVAPTGEETFFLSR